MVSNTLCPPDSRGRGLAAQQLDAATRGRRRTIERDDLVRMIGLITFTCSPSDEHADGTTTGDF